jgi:seryl-tRNA synthetase
MIFPPVISVRDLDRINYWRDFPDQGVLVSQLAAEVLRGPHLQARPVEAIPNTALAASEYALVPAACYSAYLYLSDSVLAQQRNITALAQCFRNQTLSDGVRKLSSFTQRKIVFVGFSDPIRVDLARTKEMVLAFATEIGVRLEVRPAAVTRLDANGPRADLRNLFQADEEFVYEHNLVVGHTNFHRNYFSQRCNIRTSDHRLAFAGCVGMVHEQWLSALLGRFNGDVAEIRSRLTAYCHRG